MRIKALIISLTLLTLLTLFGSLIYASSNNKEHVLWDKIPISFIVEVGQERIISFPDSVTIRNTDNNLTSDKLSILNNQGALYIKAKKDFEPVRIAVTLQKTGEVVLVDISAKPNASSTPVEVMLKDEEYSTANTTNTNATNTNSNAINTNIGTSTTNTGANTTANTNTASTTTNTTAAIDYVSLMRIAIQELYAPQRLRQGHNDIKRTPMYTDSSIALFWGLPVIAMPIASWTSKDLYVTAVMIKNASKRKITIELGAIKGNWLAASFYPSDELSKAGTKADRTTLFLISGRSFMQAYSAYKDVL